MKKFILFFLSLTLISTTVLPAAADFYNYNVDFPNEIQRFPTQRISEERARKWRIEADRVAESIINIFWDSNIGLFRAATVKCREHDIWGSAFAVFLGVIDAKRSKTIADYFQKHYNQIVQNGYVRHLPGGVYWEKGCDRDTYQNGAYWATPVGWFVYTLDLVNPKLADQTILDMVDHFKKHGACEWIIGDRVTLPHYLASAALPLDGIRAMLERRKNESGRIEQQTEM